MIPIGKFKLLAAPRRSLAIAILEVNGGELFIRETSHEERDTGPVEAAKLQRINQTESVLDPHCSYESPISVAESYRHSLAPATASSLKTT